KPEIACIASCRRQRVVRDVDAGCRRARLGSEQGQRDGAGPRTKTEYGAFASTDDRVPNEGKNRLDQGFRVRTRLKRALRQREAKAIEFPKSQDAMHRLAADTTGK